MKFLDLAKVYIRSGGGGAGCVSFRREKFIEYGGPDGGDGVPLFGEAAHVVESAGLANPCFPLGVLCDPRDAARAAGARAGLGSGQ